MHLRQAGRTDRGVSAVSQVFNIVARDLPKAKKREMGAEKGATATSDDLSSAVVILEKLRQSEAVQVGPVQSRSTAFCLPLAPSVFGVPGGCWFGEHGSAIT